MVDPTYIARFLTEHPDVMSDEGTTYHGAMITENADGVNYEHEFNQLGQVARILIARMIGQYNRFDNQIFYDTDINYDIADQDFRDGLEELIKNGFVVVGDDTIKLSRVRADSDAIQSAISKSYSASESGPQPEPAQQPYQPGADQFHP